MSSPQEFAPLYTSRAEISQIFDELIFDISSSRIDGLQESSPTLLLKLIAELDSAESLRNFIPAPPTQLLELMEILGCAEPDIEQVENAIKVDIGLIGEIIRISNSPLYRPKFGEVTSLDRAINMIGLEGVGKIAATVIMRRTINFTETSFQQLGMKQWDYCLHCAEACQMLAPADVGFKYYLLGLTHNIGAITLLGYSQYRLAEESVGTKMLMAITHHLIRYKATEVSPRIALEWGLPDQYATAFRTFDLLVNRKLSQGDYQARSNLVKTLEIGTLFAQIYLLYKTNVLSKDISYAGLQEYGIKEKQIDQIFSRFELADAAVI